MKRRRLVVLLALVGTSHLGCFYKTYTGIYFLERAGVSNNIAQSQLNGAVFMGLQGFGFTPAYQDATTVLYIRDLESMSAGIAALQGAKAVVRVAVILDHDPTVTISDRDHVTETAFTHALKRSIEAALGERFDGRQFEFERAFDWLAQAVPASRINATLKVGKVTS